MGATAPMVDVPGRAVTPSRPWRVPRPDPRRDMNAAGQLDPAVLQAATAGDDSAFVVLYRALDPVLRRYATVLVGQDADDVVGEAWFHIARDLRRFRGDVDGFRGWCVRIVRNRAMDAVRREGRRPATPSSHTEALDRVAPDDTAAAALDTVATGKAVSLIASLPQDQAEAVFLRAVVGLDVKAAAEILGKSPGAVRVAAHRGLRRLAGIVERPDGNSADAAGVDGSAS